MSAFPTEQLRETGQSLRPARLYITPISHVNLVHFGKVGHVGEKHVDLDDLVDVGPCSLEDCGEVLDALMLFSGQPAPLTWLQDVARAVRSCVLCEPGSRISSLQHEISSLTSLLGHPRRLSSRSLGPWLRPQSSIPCHSQ